jgi:hypothetical protein
MPSMGSVVNPYSSPETAATSWTATLATYPGPFVCTLLIWPISFVATAVAGANTVHQFGTQHHFGLPSFAVVDIPDKGRVSVDISWFRLSMSLTLSLVLAYLLCLAFRKSLNRWPPFYLVAAMGCFLTVFASLAGFADQVFELSAALSRQYALVPLLVVAVLVAFVAAPTGCYSLAFAAALLTTTVLICAKSFSFILRGVSLHPFGAQEALACTVFLGGSYGLSASATFLVNRVARTEAQNTSVNR